MAKKLICLMVLLLFISPALAWLDPEDPNVDVILNTEDNQFAFNNGPGRQTEWLINNGACTTIRLKGFDDASAFKWGLSAYAGKTIVAAELHLCLTRGSVIKALAAATINAPWEEGTKRDSTAGAGDACWRWRAWPDSEWTYPGSGFATASFGNFGTLVSFGYRHADTFRQYTSGSNTWVAMKLDPALVHALILDNHGLVVTDPRFGWENGNPSVYSSEQNAEVQPRLYIKVADTTDTSPSGAVAHLTASAGDWNGEVVLSFTAPADAQADKAFGYWVRYAAHADFATATVVERWRIPRPGRPGSRDRLLLEGLTPGSTYHFWVQAYDAVGNAADPVMTHLTLPAAQSTPTLASGGFSAPDPSGRSVLEQAGVLRYWACSELAKVNPYTGKRLCDGYTGVGGDDYKKANPVWDAATNTVTLNAVRNQVAGFQLIIKTLLPSLPGLSLTASDLTGPDGSKIKAATCMAFFKVHYTADSPHYPDPVIPLEAPFSTTFEIPSASTNAGGTHQSIWADLYVPRDIKPGRYTGALTLNGDQLTAPVTVRLQVNVAFPVLPDRPTFFIDLNGYGNKWDSEASRYQVFQLAHKHRMVANTLPYGWSGSWSTDRAPVLEGSGADRSISDWSLFASTYGPFFDGTAFRPDHPAYPYHGPGEHTGIANFYTTGSEVWPVSIADTTYGYDRVFGGRGHAHWNTLVDNGGIDLQTFWAESPDVMAAFPPGYAAGARQVWRQFAQYAQDHNWTTAFQMYLNNKRTYSGTNALWTLEEQYVADDFRADRWFLGLCRKGWESADAPDVRFHWRIDTSTRWQQNWGQLKDIVNLRVQGDGKTWDYRQDRYRRYLDQHPAQRWWYGTGPGRSDSLYAHSAEILTHWSHGMDGGLPYWNCFHTNWSTATGADTTGQKADLSLMLSGDDVPGHGAFDGRIATLRMKGMRHGQQIAELLNLLAAQPGWNRSKVARALSNGYGDHEGVAYDAFGGDGYSSMALEDYYRLRQDLVTTLTTALLQTIANGDGHSAQR